VFGAKRIVGTATPDGSRRDGGPPNSCHEHDVGRTGRSTRCVRAIQESGPPISGSVPLSKAEEQHRKYEALLGELGATVVSLPAEPDYPDSTFVEDPAVVVEEIKKLKQPPTTPQRRIGF